ncbi:hypothetical protein KIL84_011629 [Mauremys mutica]|uniref:Uncharacterized protein n=1 Tax=Mauremys mutica TaxID=74926 RepID=A0A9D4AVI9_9SAUR|nr:hypothetical protein KIL84_011629 [Mauremys mutica]
MYNEKQSDTETSKSLYRIQRARDGKDTSDLPIPHYRVNVMINPPLKSMGILMGVRQAGFGFFVYDCILYNVSSSALSIPVLNSTRKTGQMWQKKHSKVYFN